MAIKWTDSDNGFASADGAYHGKRDAGGGYVLTAGGQHLGTFGDATQAQAAAADHLGQNKLKADAKAKPKGD